MLAACAEMLWNDRPMAWRLKRLTEMGFEVGLWNWPNHDVAMLEKSGARFSSMTGYLRGRLADDEGAAELLTTAAESIAVGKRLNVARLNLHGTGLGDRGLPVTPCETVTGAMWLKARDTLNRIADLAAAYGVGLAKNHPFIDGNKRTAFVAVELFLMLNGWELTAGDADCVLTMLNVAASVMDESAYAEWLRGHIERR